MQHSLHGPFERIVLSFEVEFPPMPDIPPVSSLSVYRVGDILIDTGSSLVVPALVEALRDTPPDKILLTHQHEDHAGGIVGLREAYGAVPVHAPRPHLPVIRAPDPVQLHRAAYWGQPEPVQDVLPYDPGDVFETRGLALEAVATPGHTPGHIAFVARWGDDVFALSGDLFFTSRLTPAFFESAADDMAASQRRLAEHGDALRMLPSHGKVRADGAATLRATADAIDRQSDAVRAKAEELGTTEPWTVAEALFGPDPVGRLTGGEISSAAFVRSVLDPVRALPASALSAPKAPG